jgi:hypothetical protein
MITNTVLQHGISGIRLQAAPRETSLDEASVRAEI